MMTAMNAPGSNSTTRPDRLALAGHRIAPGDVPGRLRVQRRDQDERWVVPADEALATIQEILAEMAQAQKDRFKL